MEEDKNLATIESQKKTIVWLSIGLAIAVIIGIIISVIGADYSIRLHRAENLLEQSCNTYYGVSQDICDLGVELIFR